MKKSFWLMIKLPFFFLLVIVFAGCSSSKRSYNRGNKAETEAGNSIRVLLDEQGSSYTWSAESMVYLNKDGKNLTKINPGNSILISNSGDEIYINIEGKNFIGKEFLLTTAEPGVSLNYNGNYYKGTLKILPDGTEIKVLNILPIEEYLKGVIPREMPVGKGNEYYEALKAFIICARTYTISKKEEKKNTFDVFSDTRDQVYGGCGIENDIMNSLVDDTRGLILTYEGKPAATLYHSTCGGYTENVKNVFPQINAPYLSGVKDGNKPYCSISPKFTWTEKYDEHSFIKRFVSSGYLDNADYSFSGININSVFKSGRIDELEVNFLNRLNELKTVELHGNNIRYVIRRADNKSILESSNFNIYQDSLNNIVITGRGYGHGVGLCQWGALAQSKQGRTYEEILSFYYPGTEVENYNDQ